MSLRDVRSEPPSPVLQVSGLRFQASALRIPPRSDFNSPLQLSDPAATTMTRLYLIIPVLLLALFGGVYWQHTRTVAAEAVQHAAIATAAMANAAMSFIISLNGL